MKKYISVGMYGLHRNKTHDNNNVQFGLASGMSYLPDFKSQVVINFHKSTDIEITNEGAILTLNLEEAKMLSTVLNNLTNHLDHKVMLSKQNMLKDEAYFDDDDSNETY